MTVSDDDRFSMRPIGVARTAFKERVEVPRQPNVTGPLGSIELFSWIPWADALSDLETWTMIWVVFVFHENRSWRPKVLPPRSQTKRGVFATRSPHRPNPIGISAVRLERVEGASIFVHGLDVLDETPVLDVKPYVTYADCHPEASGGWLAKDATDPGSRYEVEWSALALSQCEWILQELAFDLRTRVDVALRLGPEPHAYRRIRRTDEGYRLAVKDWRIDFKVDGDLIDVERIRSGYSARELLHTDAVRARHCAFVKTFG